MVTWDTRFGTCNIGKSQARYEYQHMIKNARKSSSHVVSSLSTIPMQISNMIFYIIVLT